MLLDELSTAQQTRNETKKKLGQVGFEAGTGNWAALRADSRRKPKLTWSLCLGFDEAAAPSLVALKLVGLATENVCHTNVKDALQLFLLRANHDKPGPLLVDYWSK